MFIAEVLSNSTVEDLKKIAKNLGVKGYSKLKKAELINYIITYITSEEVAMQTFLLATEEELKRFRAALNSNVVIRVSEGNLYQYFYERCYFAINQKNEVIIPSEVREVYEKVNQEDFWSMRRRFQRLLEYCKAAVALYGIVSMEKMSELIQKYEMIAMDKKEMESLGQQATIRQQPFTIYKKCFVANEVLREEQGFEFLLERQDGKAYYMPGKAEFIKYANPAYIERNRQYYALQKYVSKYIVGDYDKANALCDKIYRICALEKGLTYVAEMITKEGIGIISHEHAEQFISYVANLYNTTRMISNRGYTMNECNPERYPANLLLPTEHTSKESFTKEKKKIGRNEPCPCGSGRKYKQCCARV